MKIKKIFLNIIIASWIMFSIIGCGDEDAIQPYGKPVLVGISEDITYFGDTITIYGKNFGLGSDKSYICFLNKDNLYDTINKIASIDCIRWTESKISFFISDSLQTSLLAVRIGRTLTKKMLITIKILPDIEMVEIPSGEFFMGSENGYSNERPIHQVKITKAFMMAKFEINQLVWQKVIGLNPSAYPDKNLPVHNITWYEAVRFCNAISKKLGYDTCYFISNDTIVDFNVDANGYRLPTEAEWEYACRAGTKGDFSGNDINLIAWYSQNSGYMPHASGQLEANAFGLYDVHGNVWEWCWDWFSETHYEDSIAVDPIGPKNGIRRVLRGGASNSGVAFLRSSNRAFLDNDYKFCGLRVVRNK